MNDNEKFERYKQIKREISYNYRGYPIEKIAALDLIVHVYVKRKYNLKRLLSFIFKGTLPIYKRTLNLEELNFHEPRKTLFSMGIYKRSDYYEIWEYAKSHVKSLKSFDFSKQEYRSKINFHNIKLALSIVNRTKKLGWKQKYRLAANITYYLNIIDDLEEIAPVAAKYCSFSSVHEHETILTCYFQKKGIPTYSLQHGFYSVYNRNIPLDAILYENFVSDYHLCWGSATKDEFSAYGINRDSLVVAGYARKVQRSPVPQKPDKKSCLLLLARYSYHDSNVRLLEILEKFSEKYQINFQIKLHPSLYMNKYYPYYVEKSKKNNWTIAAKEITVFELLKEGGFGWSVSVNTSAYYEAYIQYMPCLRYNDGTFENMVDIMQDDFSNQKELEKRFYQIPFNNPQEFENYCKEIDKRLDYTIGINTDNYSILNAQNSRSPESGIKKMLANS